MSISINSIYLVVGFILIFSSTGNSNGSGGGNSVAADKEIPMTKFSLQNNMGGGPKLSFLYCHSCGYRKAFEEYSTIIMDKYPQFTITGENYDPPNFNYLLSKIILFTKLALICLLMTPFDIWGYLGRDIPAWYQWCTGNKLYASMMIFFVGNMLEAQLISSGAFEITLNDVPVWSKLQTGRIPAPQELFQIIESHLLLTNKLPDFNE